MTGLKPEETKHFDEGGSPSLELLYRRHFRWLVRVVRNRFGNEHAEDLVQETYARVASRQNEAIQNPRAFLLQVATRLAIDQQRRQVTRAAVSAAASASGDVLDASSQAEQLLLKQVILSLPPPLRDTFLLSRVAGLTYDEIAQQQGISLKTVEWRISKALKHCAQALAPNGRN